MDTLANYWKEVHGLAVVTGFDFEAWRHGGKAVRSCTCVPISFYVVAPGPDVIECRAYGVLSAQVPQRSYTVPSLFSTYLSI